MLQRKKKIVKKRVALHKDLPFVVSEQYKRLRTNLQFTITANVKCPIIGITSSIRGEGKSTTAVNLAYAFAENEKKVLLIDGDLRLPTVAKKMEKKNARGLTDFLLDEETDIEKFRSDVLENWYILPTGKKPPNPSELLGSPRMETLLEKFRESFDYIIIDLPPVNIVSDALSIAKFLTGFVVVAREEYTHEKEVDQCIRSLQLSGANILGLAMNGAKISVGNYKYGEYR